MITGTLGGIEMLLRSIAYDIMCRRDRLLGWRQKRKEFLASAKKSPECLKRDIESRLRKILIHAYETSPYYRELWRDMGLCPSSSIKFADLQQFPFLTKDIIKHQKSSLISERYRKNDLDLSYTGGTTGTQTSFYRDHECTVSRVGRQWGILEHCGYRPGMRRALIWGAHADLPASGMSRSAKQWFREFANSQEIFCCTVMSEQEMIDYHGRLQRFRPNVLYGYPSAMVQLGRFIQGRNLNPIRVRTIITTAERLDSKQREFLQAAFKGEVFNLYCTREYGCIGFECEKHKGFHIDSESVIVEIIKGGRQVDSGVSGEITITDLLNYGMPFIRSRSGDMGTLSTEPCECGSSLPILKALDGRVTDNVYRPDGSIVAGLMLTDLFWDMPAIEAAQFVQESLKELDVFLVVTNDFTGELEKEVIRQVRELMGREIAIRIRRVPEIARSPRSGKYQEVICRIEHESLNAGGTP